MRRRRFTKTIALALLLVLVLPLQAANGAYQKSVLPTFSQTASVQARQALPIRLKIPRIKVNASIQYVGLTSVGAIGVPNSRSAVAWYKLGPRPGESGSAVIVGHSGSKPGPATVFDNLYKLREGDVLYVLDSKGKSIPFVVREVRTYSPTAIVPEVFTSEGIHLNLITCIWNPSKRSFTKRFVVFTDLKS